MPNRVFEESLLLWVSCQLSLSSGTSNPWRGGGKATVVVKLLVHALSSACETLCRLQAMGTGSLDGMLAMVVSFYAALHF